MENLEDLDKVFRQQIHICQELLEQDNQDEVVLKALQSSRAAISLLQRYSDNEEDEKDRSHTLKIALQNYTQSVLDSTYHEECKLSNAEFADKLFLKKVVDIDKALSLPPRLCGSPEGVISILGTEILECLYWRVGALLYMYCHSFFEKEERRKEIKSEVFLNCCCAAVGHLHLMLSARTPLGKDEDYISHDTDMVQLLEQGIFSDIHMLSLMYAGELCYWAWVVTNDAPSATTPPVMEPHPSNNPKTRTECKRDNDTPPQLLQQDKGISKIAGRNLITDIITSTTADSTVDVTSSDISKLSITSHVDSGNTPNTAMACSSSVPVPAGLESGCDHPAIDSPPHPSRNDVHHTLPSSPKASKTDTSSEKNIATVEVNCEGYASEIRPNLPVETSGLDLYHVMRCTRGEEYVLRWKCEFNAIQSGLEMLSKYINAARGPLKHQGWNYSKAVELVVKLRKALCGGDLPRGPRDQQNTTPPEESAHHHHNPATTAGHNDQQQQEGQCSGGRGGGDCGHCEWTSKQGIRYSLKAFSGKLFQIGLGSPKGSLLKFYLCSIPGSQIPCQNGAKSPTCLTVPGVKPTNTGMNLRIEQLEPNIPGHGIQLIYEEGEICEVTKIPRKTIMKLPCDEKVEYPVQNFHPKQAREGQKKEICQYFIEFPPSKFGCPIGAHSDHAGSNSEQEDVTVTNFVANLVPQLLAVTGCQDSDPARTTEECHYAGKIRLVLHGINLHALCSPPVLSNTECVRGFDSQFSVYIGEVKCSLINLVSQHEINCTVESGSGKDKDVTLIRNSVVEGSDEPVAVLKSAVSFKEKINYRERFSKFVEMGVGGMKREIDELFRRAFASRGTAPELLEQLGIGHVKGILLYGPPGSGKTLLARTIANILGSKQVSLINGPEVISKYLGESEKNLRSHFKEAHIKWTEYGALSDLFVIIIDEIDAICKPRGKTDQSAAGVAYDALVNQLLTLMDGLNEIHNVIVIGLTNRRELLDSALLRPGRFEVQIEVTLPDQEGRKEIFEIHTREMKKNGLLGSSVNLWELAANTSRFSGAEIAGVVRAASSYALSRYQLRLDSVSNKSPSNSIAITSSDFSRAIQDINPAYTQSESHVLAKYFPLSYLPCGESHDSVIESGLDMIHILMTSLATRVQSLLIYGPKGSGKTTLAAHLAMMGKFSFVKILTASSLMGQHDMTKIDIMYQAFNDAYKSETAIIILDDLHRLVEYVQVGQQIQVSHSLLHTLFTLLTATPPSNTKMMVIGTMTCLDQPSLEDPPTLGLPDLFRQNLLVPLLGPEEIKRFLDARNIRRLDGSFFALPGNLVISVEQLVHSVDCVCAKSEESCTMKHNSRVRQDHLLDCIMTIVSK